MLRLAVYADGLGTRSGTQGLPSPPEPNRVPDHVPSFLPAFSPVLVEYRGALRSFRIPRLPPLEGDRRRWDEA